MIYFSATDNALFAGTEQEGPMQGTETLFVVGEVNVGILDDHMQAHEATTGRKIGQVYLGAGFLSRCGPNYVRHIAAFLDTGGDALTLTVEASYLGVSVLRDTPRVDHWVYTAMMLGSINPNYKQTMEILTNKELQKRMDFTPDLIGKVSIKTDFAGTTMVVAATDVAFSKYGDYGEDTMLWATDGFNREKKVPHPMVVGLSSNPKKQEVLERWYREQIRKNVPRLIAKWEHVIGVNVRDFYVQRMKTKWGSCSALARTIRLNSELAKKPRECLEYIVVHEMVHLLERTHNRRFMTLMEQFMPRWQSHRELLDRLPVRREKWVY